MATSFKSSCACTAALSAPDPAAGHCWPMPPPESPGHIQVSLGQSLVGSLLLSPVSWCTQDFVCALQESVSPVLWKFWQLCGGVNDDLRQEGLCHSQVCCTGALPLRQATADLYLRRRHSNTQRQAWLSLCRVSWCTQGFVWGSLAGVGFDCKHNFSPPTVFWGFSSKSWNTLIGGLPAVKFYLYNNILVPHF